MQVNSQVKSVDRQTDRHTLVHTYHTHTPSEWWSLLLLYKQFFFVLLSCAAIIVWIFMVFNSLLLLLLLSSFVLSVVFCYSKCRCYYCHHRLCVSMRVSLSNCMRAVPYIAENQITIIFRKGRRILESSTVLFTCIWTRKIYRIASIYQI